MLIVDRAQRLARGEGGFSLVEMLVAVSTGLVITLALFGLLEVATRQTRQVTNKVQSDRLGRLTMNRIVTQLHSACIAREAVPVYSASTENKLVFYNAYSEGAELKTPSASKAAGEGVYVHELVYEKTAGKIREKVYPSTEVALPSKVVYSAKAEREVLVAEHVTQAKSESGGELPIFEYLKYRSASTTGVNAQSTSLEPVELKSGETLEAKEKTKTAGATNVSGVGVNFEQAPVSKQSLHEYANQGVSFQSQVTLALGSPNAETPIKDAPCD
jgi:Tfp pilus assembly protein PilV